MNLRLRHRLLGALLAVAATGAWAQDERQSLVRQILAAQGLEQSFELQMAQARQTFKGYGEQALARVSGGAPPDPRAVAALERFLERSSRTFVVQEYIDQWARHYGAQLSDDELRQVLDYYQSPVGRKDVAATQVAMAAFSSWLSAESRSRTLALMAELGQELERALR
jgi:hypothetical protein